MTDTPSVAVITEADAWKNDGNSAGKSTADTLETIVSETAVLAFSTAWAAGVSPPSLSAIEPKRLELSVLLTDDDAIAELNHDHRGKDGPTNVLTYAAFDDADTIVPPDGPVPLGDVVIAFETVDREAKELGISRSDHVRHMVTHGVLHILGYDHIDEAEAEVMEDLERKILAALNVADPYAAGQPAPPKTDAVVSA